LIANANPAPLKTITGFISPESVAVDPKGEFFVCDTFANTVYGFKPGAIQPYVRYDRGLTNPYDAAIGADGTLYVINNPAKGPTVVEFAPGKDAPTRTLRGIPGQPGSLAFDGQNDLYVAYMASEGVGGVETFAPGATSGTNLNLVGMPQPSGIVVDSSGDIVVSGFLTVPVGQSQSRAVPAIAFYLAGVTQPTFPTGVPLFPGALALTPDESTIFVADSQESLLTFQYGPSADFAPLGVLPLLGGDVRGVAGSPPDPA
jgi:sugar lactone lactonase YvrE